MLKVQLTDAETNKKLETQKQFGEPVLITQTHRAIFGTFKAVTNSGSQTQTIVAPPSNDGLVLTDLLISSDKTANSTVTVRFTDGTNTINIFVGDSSNAPITLGIAFQGHWAGWQGARLELLTDTVGQSATATVGYYKVDEKYVDTFTAWDAKR